MGPMSDNQTYRVTCSYCLNTYLTVGHEAHIARHGFTVQGQTAGQGLLGCWHTGPCDGFEYAHLGISNQGTKFALSRIQSALDMNRRRLVELGTRPVLHYTETFTAKTAEPWARGAKHTQTFEIRDGDSKLTYSPFRKSWMDEHYNPVTKDAPEAEPRYEIILPSYEKLLAHNIKETSDRIASLEQSEKTYTYVIETWTAEQYAPVAVERKASGPVLHKQVVYQDRYRRPMCSRSLMSRGIKYYAETDEQVTCSRCKARMAAKAGQ